VTVTVAETAGLAGAGTGRVDGLVKATGAARYLAASGVANLAYAVLPHSSPAFPSHR